MLYKGVSGDLQSSWLQDFDDSESAYFGSSKNSQSSYVFGLKWLEQVFDRETRDRARNRRRLLIVDGYSSYINLKFISTYDRLRILILILLPYLTHRLQPLDVSMFGLLVYEYSQGLDNLIFKSLGFVSINKAMFQKIFKVAQEASFIKENIQNAQRKSGIWLINPQLVITQITRPEPPIPIQVSTTTPYTSKACRHLKRQYDFNPTTQGLQLIFKSWFKLFIEYSIDKHVKQGLFESLVLEKKKRKKGKKLNLVGEDDKGP